jgi:hypothetical protein
MRDCGAFSKLYSTGMANTKVLNPTAPIALKDFFERTPPGTWAVVGDVPMRASSTPPTMYAPPVSRKLPELDLHCDQCDGVRTFSTQSDLELDPKDAKELFVSYFCRNCRACAKTYAILARKDANGVATIFKYGEVPAFGPPLPSKLIELIRPEWDYFQKGRRAENQGLGIGSFAYYRRVIDSQKNRILDEIIRAANKLGAASEVIEELEQAKRETQFTKAIEGVKHALPPGLWIEGANPLTLVYSALSIGLHGESDAECLAAATDVRIVMTELAERLVSVLKDDNELKNAVARLARHNSSA